MVRKKPILFAILLTLLAVGVGGNATSATLRGSEAAVTFSMEGTIGVGVLGNTVGWGFRLDEERTLTHLGVYNYNGSGSADSDRQIGIWDASGKLIAHATLRKGGGTLADGFIWVALLRRVQLNAGENYTIGAWYPDNSPGIAYNATVSTISGVIYEKPTLWTSTPSFAQPTVDNSLARPNGYFGPNMRLATDNRIRADRDTILIERNQRRRNLLLNLEKNYPLCGPGTQNQLFVVSKDGLSVCDNKTGLWWQQTPGKPGESSSPCDNGTPCEWEQARAYCAGLNDNEEHIKKLWRLPTVMEMQWDSLIDYRMPNQATALNSPNGPFDNVQPRFYWSATEEASEPDDALSVSFELGFVGSDDKKLNLLPAWCVSSGKDAN